MDASKVESYKRTIEAAIPSVINRTALGIGSKYTGKVRDVYFTSKHLLLLTTDRLSAFDRLLACIPFKGRVFSRRGPRSEVGPRVCWDSPCRAVLNLTAAWWFEKTAHIIPNHIVAVPHPNVVSQLTPELP